MLDKLKYGDFAEYLNTKFRVVEAVEPFEIEFDAISEQRTGGGQEYFSLYFLGNKDKFLPQGLHQLEHETLGSGLIFLVPVGEDEENIKYEAVFNRLKKD